MEKEAKKNISEEKEIQMPVSVAMEKATQEMIEKLNEVSNKYHLPFYLLLKVVEPISQELVRNIQLEKENYEESIKEKGDKK